MVYLPPLASSQFFPLQPISPCQTTLPNAAPRSALPLSARSAPSSPNTPLLHTGGPHSPWTPQVYKLDHAVGWVWGAGTLPEPPVEWWWRHQHQPQAKSAPSCLANYGRFYGPQHCAGTQSHPSHPLLLKLEENPVRLRVRSLVSSTAYFVYLGEVVPAHCCCLIAAPTVGCNLA